MIIEYINSSRMEAWTDRKCVLTLKKAGTDWHVIRGGEVLASLPMEEALKFARKALKKTVSKK